MSSTNTIQVHGRVSGDPVFSHGTAYGTYYKIFVEARRQSGVTDRVPVLLPEALADQVSAGMEATVTGEIRSHNNPEGTWPRLMINILASDIEACSHEDFNIADLTGFICREPVLRTTLAGRTICDMLLAVHRQNPGGPSDYLPVILWGGMADRLSKRAVGEKLQLAGRLQSRAYRKQLDDGSVEERVAYEVSVYYQARENPQNHISLVPYLKYYAIQII